MTRRMTTHDEFFRGAMMDLEVARDFLKQHLPKHLQKIVKLETLKLEPSTFINKELKERTADLLYSVEILGEESYIYTLIEQQTQPDRFMPVRD